HDVCAMKIRPAVRGRRHAGQIEDGMLKIGVFCFLASKTGRFFGPSSGILIFGISSGPRASRGFAWGTLEGHGFSSQGGGIGPPVSCDIAPFADSSAAVFFALSGVLNLELDESPGPGFPKSNLRFLLGAQCELAGLD
ncbi:MAG: hypothetical protein N2322_07670, partial [Terrimicrobiaceae bacterium]|nr:hypothetical protein [Terrimicrobiaceae bacterium]